MRRSEIACLAVFLFSAASLSSTARAQSAFSGGSTALDPQIRVINSGVVLDAQPVVSHDEKYVTINARVSNASLLALRTFTFAQPVSLGFVGSNALRAFITRQAGQPALSVLPVPSVLDRVGITKLD